MSNYILEYYQAIKEGSVTVGRWIIMLYEMIIHGLEHKEFFFDAKKANKAVKFIENFCHHSKGALAPQLVKLELWQKAMISCIFGIVDENGTRQFREVVAVMGRKCGKSLIASGIAENMVYADGEYGADCFFLAPRLEQTDIVFNDFWQSVSAEPELARMTKKRKTDLYIEKTNTAVKKIAFSQKKSDGFNPHITVCDEIAAWPGDAGIKQYEVMASALGSRKQPLIVSITTANYINDGIYDDLYRRSTRVLLGDSKEKRLLPFLYQIDDLEKWNDLTELQKSLPNLGVSVSVDFMLEEIAKAEGSLAAKAEFMCKYCCIKQNSTQAWLSTADVEKCCTIDFTPDQLRHSYCVGGIDLSQTIDLSSCCVVVEKDGVLYVLSHFFMPANRIDDATAEDGVPYRIYLKQGLLTLSGENYVDYHDCFNWFIQMSRQYELLPLVIGYDRYSAQYLVDEMKQAGFKMDDVYQGTNLTPVIREAEGIIKDGKLQIGQNNLLKAHLLNTALKQDTDTQKVKMVKCGTRTRIDGAAALMDALTVRQKWYAEMGAQLKNKR